jgi:catechol 2,3-dioxygenase-like lactoylglutathione lyase family enzyme
MSGRVASLGEPSWSAVRVGSVVIDCNDFERMFAFWREALGYVPRDEPEPDWVVLRDPSGAGVNVSLQVVPEPRIGKNRLHLDLYTNDRDAEVDRLLGLGASRHPRTPEPDEDFIVLADPEGNLFCVIQKAGCAGPRAPARRSAYSPHGRGPWPSSDTRADGWPGSRSG